MTDQAALALMPDEAAIRRATARFADAAIRGDYDVFRALWSRDATWIIGDPPQVNAVGPDAIVSTLRHLRSGKEFFVQFAVQGPIGFDGDTATTTCVCHEAARGPGESYHRNHCIAFPQAAIAQTLSWFARAVFGRRQWVVARAIEGRGPVHAGRRVGRLRARAGQGAGRG